MKSSLLLLLLPVAMAVSVPLDAHAELRSKKVRVDAVGQIHITSSFNRAAGDDGGNPAFVVSQLRAHGGPEPVENPVTESLVWTDPGSGAVTYASTVAFAGSAVGQQYSVVSNWYDALGNQLGTDERLVTVERRGPPPVHLDVLNPPNSFGDVVVVPGDFAQVSYAVGCDFPWLADDCAQQQAESANRDSIQLVRVSDGEVVDDTRRGRELSGRAVLKVKPAATGALEVRYLQARTDAVWGTSSVGITAVADAVTGELLSRTRELEAKVAAMDSKIAELSEGLAAANATIAENSRAHRRNWELILEIEAGQTILQGRVTKNENGITANSVVAAELGGRVMTHDAQLNFLPSGLGSPLANYEAIIRTAGFDVGEGAPTQIIFPFSEAFRVRSPAGATIPGAEVSTYAYLEDVKLVAEGEGDESAIGIYSRTNVGGVVVTEPQIVLANIGKKDPGAAVFIKDYDRDGNGNWSGLIIGTGTVSADGSVIVSDPGLGELLLD